MTFIKTGVVIILIFHSFLVNAVQVGDKAPDFTIKDRAGNAVSLRSLQGKVVLLDFWASWCAPCRAASKDLIKMYEKYHTKGFEIFSVSLDSKKEAWLKAIDKDNLYWTYHGSDFKEWESTPAQLYSIKAIPTGFLINENGIVVTVSHDAADIEAKLHEMYFTNAIPFPLTTAEKIILPEKLRFDILDGTGKSVLKGKEDMIDVTMLANGNYKLNYEDTTVVFIKIQSVTDSTAYSFNVQKKSIEFSKKTFYELYNRRGNLLKSGNGSNADLKDLAPNNYFLNVDGRIKEFIRPANN